MSKENLKSSSEIISLPIENSYSQKKISTKNNQIILDSLFKAENDEDDSKKSRIKKKLKEMLMDSTIHALPNIYKTDRILFKIMWFSFFLTTLAFSIQLITNSINDYLKYETIAQFNYGGATR
jgi:hypothetical protein